MLLSLVKMYNSKYNFVMWKISELNIMGYSGCNPYGTITNGDLFLMCVGKFGLDFFVCGVCLAKKGVYLII